MENALQTVVMNHKEIAQLLPHRPPLLLVDRVISLDLENMQIVATKCVSSLDPVFAGHFPNDPVLPGVYIVEGLAQTSALLCFKFYHSKNVVFESRCLLTTIEQAKFRKPVLPGDLLHYHVKFERSRGQFAWFVGEAKIHGECVAEAKFSALLPTSLKGL